MRKLVSGGGEVLSLTFVKKYLKVDVNDDDELIQEFIKAGRQWAEKYMRRQLISGTFDMYLDSFPDTIELYGCPASDVLYIKYYDSNGDQQTLSSDDYEVDVVSEPARIGLASDASWPSVENRINAINIRYTAGWADAASVPKPIRDGILLVIAHLYENRQAVTKDTYSQLPLGAEYLWDMYKVW